MSGKRHFIQILPYEAKKLVSQGNHTNVEELISLVESHQVTKEHSRFDKMDGPQTGRGK